MNLEVLFANFFKDYIWLAVFIMALIPFVEGRIAFSFAINESLLKSNVLNPILAILICVLASIFLTFFLLTFFKELKKFLIKFKLFKKIFTKIDKKIIKKCEKIKNKNNKYLMLSLFVFVPFPLTGVYTASLIAELLNLNFFKSIVSIVLGNFGCLILIYILSLFFKDFTLILLLLCFVIALFIFLLSKLKNKSFKIKFLND